MFAYVKFLQGPIKGVKKILSVKLIKNFEVKTWNKKLKYLAEYNQKLCAVHIIEVCDSKSKLEEIIKKKRMSVLPEHLLESASDVDKNKTSNSNTLDRFNSEKCAKLSVLLDKKLKPYNSLLGLPSNSSGESSKSIQNIDLLSVKPIDSNSSLGLPSNSSGESSKSKQNTDLLSVKPIDSYKENSSPNICAGYGNDTQKIVDDHFSDINSSENNKMQINESFTGNKINRSEVGCYNELTKIKTKPQVTSVLNVHSIDECNSMWKKKYDDLKVRFEKVVAIKTDLNYKLQEKTSELENAHKLISRLSKSVADKADTQKEMLDTIIENLIEGKGLSYNQNFPHITARRTSPVDNEVSVHIGRNVWIPERAYNRVLNTSHNPRQMAGNILLPVFDEEDLLTSTVTGYSTGRHGGKKEKVKQLDEIKFGACEDFYKYWLKDIFKEDDKAKSKLNMYVELGKFSYYAGKKISDLKRLTESTGEKKEKKAKSLKEKKSKHHRSHSPEESVSEELQIPTEQNKSAEDKSSETQKPTDEHNKSEETSSENTYNDYSTLATNSNNRSSDEGLMDWSPVRSSEDETN